MSSAKGGAKKSRLPKKTTAKKTAPRPAPDDAALTPSASAPEGKAEAGGVIPDGALSSAEQATVDDEAPASVESRPEESGGGDTTIDDAGQESKPREQDEPVDAEDERIEDGQVPSDREAEPLSDAGAAPDPTSVPQTDDEALDDDLDDDVHGEDPQGDERQDDERQDDERQDPAEKADADPAGVREPTEGGAASGSGHTTSAPPKGSHRVEPAASAGEARTAVPPAVSEAREATPGEVADGREERASEGGSAAGISDDDAASGDPTLPTRGGRTKPLGKIFAGLLAVGLGFAVMTQVRQHEKSGLDKLSQADLVALLADVNAQSSRLNTELDELRATKQKLDSGGDSAAVADAQKRLDQLAVLNGTTKVKGPGIVIAVTNTRHEVSAANILDAVEELRDAGAESIEVDDTRVVASTWFSDQDERPTVEGHPIHDTFTIRAIGDPHTMSTAMAIPGGVTDTLTQAGAQVKVTEDTSMQINSVVASNR